MVNLATGPCARPSPEPGASGPEPITVVIVDDSPVERRLLRSALLAGGFQVTGEARNGREAVALVARLRPCAVLLDLELPGMSGLEALEHIMSASPTPVLVRTARADGQQRALALAAGAVDVLAKPAPGDLGTLEQHADTLRRQLRVVARARVITHPRNRWRTTAAPAGSGARPAVRLLVIGASTGGPQALLTVLSALPPALEQAVLVVQHMADGFLDGLAGWLDSHVHLTVRVGESGRRLEPGTVTLAPSGGNFLVTDVGLRVLRSSPEPGQHHVPGIDATMRSVADALGPAAIGVVLTGMGRDGALGLTAMHDRGAVTVAQDEASSVVYGMPAAAMALGGVDHQLPVHEIAGFLRTTLQQAGT